MRVGFESCSEALAKLLLLHGKAYQTHVNQQDKAKKKRANYLTFFSKLRTVVAGSLASIAEMTTEGASPLRNEPKTDRRRSVLVESGDPSPSDELVKLPLGRSLRRTDGEFADVFRSERSASEEEEDGDSLLTVTAGAEIEAGSLASTSTGRETETTAASAGSDFGAGDACLDKAGELVTLPLVCLPTFGDDGLIALASALKVANGLLLLPRINSCFTKHFGGI